MEIDAAKNLQFYANTFSAVIAVHDGQIDHVTWDNRCGTCQEGKPECRNFTLNAAEKVNQLICDNSKSCGAPKANCMPRVRFELSAKFNSVKNRFFLPGLVQINKIPR